MIKLFSYLGCLSAIFAVPVFAQQSPPSAMTMAQAQDRCMTTYAVRLSRDSQDDEAIYEAAKGNCAELDAKLIEAIDRELPAETAQQIKAQMAEQARPNFMVMIAKIRADRVSRASQ